LFVSVKKKKNSKEKGKLEVIINQEVKRLLKPGEGFGELALMYNAPRSATIMAQEKSFCWGIDRLTFRNAVEQMVTKDFEDNRRFIEKVNFFRKLWHY
jgi:cGMP-dependent protein kinase